MRRSLLAEGGSEGGSADARAMAMTPLRLMRPRNLDVRHAVRAAAHHALAICQANDVAQGGPPIGPERIDHL
jgi:hypothetical protein